MLLKCEGIILRRHNFGEADRILVIFTDHFGKVSAVGRSVRKTLSKLAGHLELFCHTKLLLAEGKNLDVVAESQNLETFPKLRANLKLTSIAYYFSEILDKITREKEENLEIFKLFLRSLQRLNEGKDDLLKNYFEVNLLFLSGFSPELQRCVFCRQRLDEKHKNFFSAKLGGVLNQQCKMQDKSAIPISQDCIKLLRILLKYKIGVLDKLKVEQTILRECDKVLQIFIQFVLEREIKSSKFLKEVSGMSTNYQ